jgi:membrane-associated protease RseP (regulator of RpoE activity)
MFRSQLVVAALAMLVAAPVLAADPSQAEARAIHEEAVGPNGAGTIHIEGPAGFEFQQVGPNVTFRRAGGGLPRPYATDLFADTMQSKYWLGVHCAPVPAMLRSHVTLPEKQGLVVLQVTPDSPAAKAGLAQYDVLLRVGGKPVADARDLLAAVEAAKETKLKVELIRSGKPQTIEVTPAKRPAQAANATAQVPEQGDWSTIESWLEGMTRGQAGGGANPPVQFRVFGPGAIVPNNVLIPKPLPTNMSVAIAKEGNGPAKIKIQRGNDRWEITEKDLDKLPADVRPFVEQMLGRGMVGTVGGPLQPGMFGGFSSGGAGGMASGGTFPMTPPPPGTMQVQPFPGGLDQQIEKRFEEMNHRMDQLFKMMEELNEGHAQHATPEHPEEK